MDNGLLNAVGSKRISARQVDELLGMARGIAADGVLNQREAEFLHKWLAANVSISNEPMTRMLYARVQQALNDGVLDSTEASALLEALNSLSDHTFEAGDVLKSTTLPFDQPEPELTFQDTRYCFTGEFEGRSREDCELAVIERGGLAGSLTKKTNVLVVGVNATNSWKHSSFGNKIIKACEWRDKGHAIAIVSERHWIRFL